MGYKSMRLKKYTDFLKTQKPFLKTSLRQKTKILWNILVFYADRRKLVLKHRPLTAQIEPNSTCNLKCDMCIRDKIGIPIGNMNFEDFKKILEKLDCLFKIHLSGQGEPFMNKDIFRMINYANKRGVIVNTNTNATLLSEGVIEKICEVSMGEIAISIESTKKDRYEKIRKGAKFERVKENIKKLNENLRKKKKDTIVSLAITIMKENIEEIPEFVNLAKKIGVQKIIFQTLQEKEDYVSKYKNEARKQKTSGFQKRICEKIKEAKEIAIKNGINIIFDEERSNGCLWPWRGIYVTWNGNVTACCKILDYRKPIMGNLLQEDFWKIWNGKNYQIFRKLLRERKAPFPCKGCNRV